MTTPRVTRRALLQGATVAGVGAALTACGSGPTHGSNATTRATAVGVTDQRHRKVTLDHPARRVVTIPMPAASMLIAVDQSPDHLVGMHKASWAAMQKGILGQLFPHALSVPHDVASADFAPNVESVLALRPDVVVQWGDQGAGLTAPLENAGLKVLGLTYGTQEDLQTWITLFATMLGKPERGRALNAAVATSLQTMTAVGRAAPRPGPKVLYCNRFTGGLKVAGRNSYNDFYIRLVGATNPASGQKGAPGQGMVGVDVEQVLAWDPDIVLLGNFDDAMPDDVYGSAVWRGVSAVRARRVYKVPLGGYRWDPPSHESPLMWRWLSMLAFPGQEVDLRSEVDRHYRLCYGRSPTAQQVDAILWSSVNGASAAYHQFDAS